MDSNRITGEGPLAGVVWRLAYPVILMMYLQGAYNIIDTLWVGQLLGPQALAGIATGGFVLWSIFGLSNLVGVGVAAKIARRTGEGREEEAAAVAIWGLWFGLGLSLVVGAGLWILTPVLFVLMGTTAEVSQLGTRYLQVILLGCPLIFISFTLQRIFQAAGDTVTPMWLMFVSVVINGVLDPILMVGLFGFPELGVAGAATATVLSRLLMSAWGAGLLLSGRRIATRRLRFGACRYAPFYLPRVRKGYLKARLFPQEGWDAGLLGSIMWIGLPAAVSHTLFPLVYMAITRVTAQYGTQHVAALRIGHTVEGVSFFLAVGFSVAAATCVGQNLGAGKPGRSVRAGWSAAAMAASVLLGFSILYYGMANSIGTLFSSDPGTASASAHYLRILAFSQVFMGLEIVMGGAFSGAGDTVPPMAIAVPFNLARIPLAYLLARGLDFGVGGVWWAISGTSIFKGAAISMWFSRGRWQDRRV